MPAENSQNGSEHKAPLTPSLSYEELEALATDDAFKGKPIELKRWLFEKRLEYARNFFAHHAKQRMDMFNYFLIFAGFALAAYANVFKDAHYGTATTLAGFSAFLAIVFIFLDRRNEELVHIAEDTLEALEFDVLFAKYNGEILWPRRRTWRGKMEATMTKRPLGIFRRQTADCTGKLKEEKNSQNWESRGPSPFEHGTWLPRFQFGIFALFLCLAIIPWRWKLLAIVPCFHR
jgi:hypothetical protein